MESKWALVTGQCGNRLALAEQLASRASICANGARADRLARLANDLAARHGFKRNLRGRSHPLKRQAKSFLHRQKRLPVELLINNAGFGATASSANRKRTLAGHGAGECGLRRSPHASVPPGYGRAPLGSILIPSLDGNSSTGSLPRHLRRYEGVRPLVAESR
jgi:hypothetical protein